MSISFATVGLKVPRLVTQETKMAGHVDAAPVPTARQTVYFLVRTVLLPYASPTSAAASRQGVGAQATFLINSLY
jgi:hypothetical protein